MGYRIIREDGKTVMTAKTYAACERYWDACDGMDEDENGKYRMYIEDHPYYEYDDDGNEFYTDENGKRHYTRMEG